LSLTAALLLDLFCAFRAGLALLLDNFCPCTAPEEAWEFEIFAVLLRRYPDTNLGDSAAEK
jgi:hypothetical protein